MGPNVCIVSANHDRDDYDKHVATEPIRIGDDVWIGANSVVLPGVQIGSNVIIGAGSVVREDVPSDSIAFGNPCRVVAKKSPYLGEVLARLGAGPVLVAGFWRDTMEGRRQTRRHAYGSHGTE